MTMRGRLWRWLLIAALASLAGISTASARVRPFPSDFHAQQIRVADGSTLYVRTAGHGPAVLLLHGFGDNGDMWEPVAVRLMADHTVIIPDLRGMGNSSHPPEADENLSIIPRLRERNAAQALPGSGNGFTKAAQARDIAHVLDVLHVDHVQLVTHDIGNMVGFALAMQFRDRVTRWVVMDAPVPGIGHWTEQQLNPKTWHFDFYGPDEERIVRGRERLYLDRFWNELSADPAHIDAQTRAHYTAYYARPHAMHDAFEQFKAFRQDAEDNVQLMRRGTLTIPVLAIGGDHSYGEHLASDVINYAADNVRALVIANSGHWLMEEQPVATTNAILAFLAEGP